jgi:hypothetical protein
MRCAPLSVHNRLLELNELAEAITGTRGRLRKAARARLESLQAEKAALLASADTWPDNEADISVGVPTPCGRRVSHYMSLIGGVWVRHE